MAVKCIYPECTKTWPEYERMRVVAHHFDDHQANLQFISDEEVRMMVKEVPV